MITERIMKTGGKIVFSRPTTIPATTGKPVLRWTHLYGNVCFPAMPQADKSKITSYVPIQLLTACPAPTCPQPERNAEESNWKNDKGKTIMFLNQQSNSARSSLLDHRPPLPPSEHNSGTQSSQSEPLRPSGQLLL